MDIFKKRAILTLITIFPFFSNATQLQYYTKINESFSDNIIVVAKNKVIESNQTTEEFPYPSLTINTASYQTQWSGVSSNRHTWYDGGSASFKPNEDYSKISFNIPTEVSRSDIFVSVNGSQVDSCTLPKDKPFYSITFCKLTINNIKETDIIVFKDVPFTGDKFLIIGNYTALSSDTKLTIDFEK